MKEDSSKRFETRISVRDEILEESRKVDDDDDGGGGGGGDTEYQT